MAHMMTWQEALQAWKKTQAEPPSPYEEMAFMDGYTMAVHEMMRKLIKEMAQIEVEREKNETKKTR